MSSSENTAESNTTPKRKLNLIVGRDANGTSLDKLFGYSTTVVQKVFDEGKAIILTGTEEGEVLGSKSIVAGNIRSIMAVPLKVRDKLLGVVYIDSRLTKGLFTEEDLGIFNAMANNIAVSIQLAQARRVEREKAELQKKFEIQAAIAEMAKKVENLVDNMQQALFSIDSSGTVIEPVSKVSSTVFGEEIVGKTVFETLFRSIPKASEIYASVESAVSMIFGADELQWTLMEDSFPKKIPYHVAEEAKVFRLSTRPLYNENQEIANLMFVVDDITDLEKLEKAIREQTEKTQILQQIADIDKFELVNYFEESAKLIFECESWSSKTHLPGSANLLLRNLHTVKGNSRLLNFSKMAALVHGVEADVIQAASQPEGELETVVVKHLTAIKAVLDEYKDVAKKYLGIGATNDQTVEVPLVNIDSLREALSHLKSKISTEEYNRLSEQIENLSMPPLKVIFLRYGNMVRELSGTLGKSASFDVSGGNFAVPKDILVVLQNSIVHLLRNSLDHGLEEPARRESLGKPASGRIQIDIQRSPQELTIKLQDDGQGIDGNRIAQIAVGKGLIRADSVASMSDTEKVNLIFLPNFSSKEATTDISGRGVGMDAVKSFVESVNGQIDIETHMGKGSSFVIHIPTQRLKRAS